MTHPYDYNNYLTIEALEDGLQVMLNDDAYYGIDGFGWVKLAGRVDSPIINKGHYISFKVDQYVKGNRFLKISKKCRLTGNCLSMIFGDDSTGKTSIADYEYAFDSYFMNNENIIDVSDRFLPATTLASYCYRSMFSGCKSLTKTPELPATVLADGCYEHMFSNCQCIVNAPVLPATTLTYGCYKMMFHNCTILISAPVLPATTLAG